VVSLLFAVNLTVTYTHLTAFRPGLQSGFTAARDKSSMWWSDNLVVLETVTVLTLTVFKQCKDVINFIKYRFVRLIITVLLVLDITWLLSRRVRSIVWWVCLFVCSHNSKTTWLNFTKFFVHIAYGRGLVLLWWHCSMLHTSVLWMMSCTRNGEWRVMFLSGDKIPQA